MYDTQQCTLNLIFAKNGRDISVFLFEKVDNYQLGFLSLCF